jgi:hypothetical protein
VTGSKERKAWYITELERKDQTLQTETTTLAAQFTLFQMPSNQVLFLLFVLEQFDLYFFSLFTASMFVNMLHEFS